MLKTVNHIFPKIIHPFNLQNDGVKTYAEWQFEKGTNTIAFFTKKYSSEQMFDGKTVLDIGCGAGGKSLYYAKMGAEKVIGVDIVPEYADESAALAEKLGLSDKFTFVCSSACELPFSDGSFDTIIMNDFFEHVSEPKAALLEALRLLKAGGKIYVNFPPYFHPFGAHLSDAIYIPWVHLFFTQKTIIKAYKELISGVLDEKERLKLRFSTDENGKTRYTYINKMTVKRFKRLISELQIHPKYLFYAPLRGFLKPLTKVPVIKELFIKMVVCVIEKPDKLLSNKK